MRSRRWFIACVGSVVGCAGRTAPPTMDPFDVGDRFIARTRPESLPWRWDGAIAVLGLARVAAEGGRDRWRAFVAAYAHHHRRRAVVRMPDHCAPALALVAGRSFLDEALVRDGLEPVLRFLRSEPRNRLGALDHLGARSGLKGLYPPSIWIDSLMMYALPSVVAGDRQLRAFGLAQPEIFASVLQDPASGLFRHAYFHRRRVTRPRRPVFWLRGNGWVAAALVDMLEHDLRAVSIFQTLAAGLLRHQQPSGLWSTVVADPRTALETSGSALVAYALAKGSRLGFLGGNAMYASERAFAALVAVLRPRRGGPSLTGISGPTIPSGRNGYAAVPRRADIDYGVGAFLMLAHELTRGAK